MEPKFGLRLKDEFEARTGSIWPLNVGQVYATLQRLERDGHVASAGVEADAPSQLYRLTEQGRAELNQWLHTPPATSVPPRDEVVIKIMGPSGSGKSTLGPPPFWLCQRATWRWSASCRTRRRNKASCYRSMFSPPSFSVFHSSRPSAHGWLPARLLNTRIAESSDGRGNIWSG
jgi:DNA-binding PadR family transcriptional regulator